MFCRRCDGLLWRNNSSRGWFFDQKNKLGFLHPINKNNFLLSYAEGCSDFFFIIKALASYIEISVVCLARLLFIKIFIRNFSSLIIIKVSSHANIYRITLCIIRE